MSPSDNTRRTSGSSSICIDSCARVNEKILSFSSVLMATTALAAVTKRAKVVHRYTDLLGVEARILKARIGDHPLLVLDAPSLFARGGGPYGVDLGADRGEVGGVTRGDDVDGERGGRDKGCRDQDCRKPKRARFHG